LYWCSRNNIPVIPGGLEDCAIGDFYGLAYYRCMLSNQRPPTLNSAASLYDYLHFLFNSSEKVCAVILGGGFAKHFVMNGLISRNGADSVIYLNSSPYAEGSNAGAPVEQSISWGKSKANVKGIKVEGDFVFTFSLLASKILQEFCKI
jgi:deoxyhypusine synthase